jgi:hypothetical protein
MATSRRSTYGFECGLARNQEQKSSRNGASDPGLRGLAFALVCGWSAGSLRKLCLHLSICWLLSVRCSVDGSVVSDQTGTSITPTDDALVGITGIFWLHMNKGQYTASPRKVALTALNASIFWMGAIIVSTFFSQHYHGLIRSQSLQRGNSVLANNQSYSVCLVSMLLEKILAED